MSGYLSTQLLTVEAAAAAARQRDRHAALYSALIRSLDGGPVLEIGPGRGELLEVLSSELRDGRGAIFAIDTDAEVAEYIQRTHPEVFCRQGDPVELIADEPRCYSAVFMMHVLEHLDVDYAVRLLSEIRRHLSAGGVLVIEVPNSACTYVGKTIFSSDVTHKTPYTSVSLRQICSMSGFQNITIHGIRPAGKGLERYLQRALVAALVALDRLVHKIFLPSWSFLHEPTIYAIVRAPSSPPET